LHSKSGFDENWARQTAEIWAYVFDLVWLVVFKHHPVAFERVQPLSGKYPVVSGMFEKEKEPAEV
jgi:hypothetical protein